MKFVELSAIYTDNGTPTGRLYYGNDLRHKVSRMRPKNLDAVKGILLAGWPESKEPEVKTFPDGATVIQYIGDNGRGYRAIVKD